MKKYLLLLPVLSLPLVFYAYQDTQPVQDIRVGAVQPVTEAQVNNYLSQIATKERQYQRFVQVLPGQQIDGIELPPNVRIDTYGNNQYIVVVQYADKEVEYIFDANGLVSTKTYTYANASST